MRWVGACLALIVLGVAGCVPAPKPVPVDPPALAAGGQEFSQWIGDSRAVAALEAKTIDKKTLERAIRVLISRQKPRQAVDALWKFKNGEVGMVAASIEDAVRQLGQTEYEERRFDPEFIRLIGLTESRLMRLPREARARAAWSLVNARKELTRGDERVDPGMFERYFDEYRGTIVADRERLRRWISGANEKREAILDDYSRRYGASDLGLYAKYLLAQGLTSPAMPGTGLARLRRLIALVDSIEQSAGQDEELAVDARSLLASFYWDKQDFSSSDAAEGVELYRRFLRQHLRTPFREGRDPAYMIQSKAGTLLQLAGRPSERISFVESLAGPEARAELDWLRARVTAAGRPYDDEVRLLRWAERAVADYERVERSGNPQARAATFAIADLHFEFSDDGIAERALRRAIELDSRNASVWPLRLKLGLVLEHKGDAARAAAEYRAAQVTPIGHMFGNELLARMAERKGTPTEALKHRRAIIDSWPAEFGDDYTWYVGRRAPLAEPLWGIPLSRSLLTAEIARSPIDARIELELRRRRAEVQRAFDAQSPAIRRRLLEAIARGPMDSIVFQARLALAALDHIDGRQIEAARSIDETLSEWMRAHPVEPAGSALVQDVQEIRALMFRPLGGGPFDASEHSGGWPARLPAFVVADPSIRVKLSTDEELFVANRQTFPGIPSVLWLQKPELEGIEEILNKIGGTRQGPSRSIMELNRPVGGSISLLELFSSRFPARPGHMVVNSWELLTAPSVHSISFMNAERTKAAVGIGFGYSGTTAVLEKINGRWAFVKFSGFWIS